MIARVWRGRTPAAKADAYAALLERTGLSDYRATPGNRGVLALRRVQGDIAEFELISFWESFEAIRRFAGGDEEKAFYYPEDDDLEKSRARPYRSARERQGESGPRNGRPRARRRAMSADPVRTTALLHALDEVFGTAGNDRACARRCAASRRKGVAASAGRHRFARSFCTSLTGRIVSGSG
jgi:heme-degrading monooxygenase HmoA